MIQILDSIALALKFSFSRRKYMSRRSYSAATLACLLTVISASEPIASAMPRDVEDKSEACKAPSVAAYAVPNPPAICLDWYLAEKSDYLMPEHAMQFPQDRQPILVISSFNFINYDLEIVADARTIEAYKYLDDLLNQLLGMALPAVGVAGGDEFDQTIVDWRIAIDAAESTARKAAVKYKDFIGLGPDALVDVERMIGETDNSKTSLATQRDRARLLLNDPRFKSSANYDLYLRIVGVHNTCIAMLDEFISRARTTTSGKTYPLEHRTSGTLVSLALTASPRDKAAGANSPRLSLDYFVKSRFPVLFHVGYSLADIGEMEVEKIRALDGIDLFALTGEDSTREDLVGLLSYQILSWGDGEENSLLASLGTNLDEPGEVLLAGVSVKLFRRFFITAGVASAEVAEVSHPVVEEIGGQLGARELFATLDKRRDLGAFVSLSFGVR